MVYDINGKPIGTQRAENVPNPLLHISLDDVEYCIKNLATNDFDSLFDEPLFGMLKEMHDEYGAVFSLYLYKLASAGLANVPDKYQQEYIDNSRWLKFGFHQYDNASTYDVTTETATTHYNTFVSGVYNMCGGIGSIDRIPRLNYYAGTLAAIQGLRDANCGITGLLTADDSRNSYYLTESQADYIRAHSLMYDRENGLAFMDTGFRLDWFVNGYTSEYQYAVPVKSNPYDELVYRYGQPDMGECYQNLVVFLHEWRVYSSSYQITASMKNMIEQVCRFGRDYGYDFDYPMNRVPNITSLALS